MEGIIGMSISNERGLLFLSDLLECGCAIDDDFLCSFFVLPA